MGPVKLANFFIQFMHMRPNSVYNRDKIDGKIFMISLKLLVVVVVPDKLTILDVDTKLN